MQEKQMSDDSDAAAEGQISHRETVSSSPQDSSVTACLPACLSGCLSVLSVVCLLGVTGVLMVLTGFTGQEQECVC